MKTSWILKAVLAVWLVSYLEASAAAAWPKTDWETDLSVEPEVLQKFYDSVFAREKNPEDAKLLRTDAVVIVKNGRIVAERYYRDRRADYSYDAHAKHVAWSMTKSIVNGLLGAAVQEDRIALRTPLSVFYPEIQSPFEKAITVQDALEFSTGLDWTESYEGNDLRVSSVIAMLYGPGHHDMASYVAGQKAIRRPGTYWRYSSGDPLLTTGALRKVYADEPLEYPWSHLFDRIGMHETTFETDAQGTFIGGSAVYSTARDLARFGLLFAREGKWEQDQILPPGWTQMCASAAPAFKYTAIANPKTAWVGGVSFWPNVAMPERDLPLRFSAIPEGAYLASGHWGQMIAIIPNRDIVIVRLGDDRDGRFNQRGIVNDFLSLALSTVGEH